MRFNRTFQEDDDSVAIFFLSTINKYKILNKYLKSYKKNIEIYNPPSLIHTTPQTYGHKRWESSSSLCSLESNSPSLFFPLPLNHKN